MNFNFENYLYLFKLLLLNQNNATEVWLILLGMRSKKTWFLKENGVIGFWKWTLCIICIVHTHIIYCSKPICVYYSIVQFYNYIQLYPQ